MSYSPASVLTSGTFPNLTAIHYERMAVPNLKAKTPFLSCTKQKPLPLRSGSAIQFYTYALLGSNTTQSAEGTVGSPVTESTTKITATIGQYSDFINSSDLAMDVAIDDPGLLESLANELNYRLALTLNTLVQTTADAAVAVDSTVNVQMAAGTFLTANNIRSAAQGLQAVNVQPFAGENYAGIIHPSVVRDVLNDNTLNSLTDILKRGSDEDKASLKDLPANDEVITFAGVRFKQTSTTPIVNIGGNNYYNTYVFGDDAVFSVFLGKNETGDKAYKLHIQNAPENGSVSDPARNIGGWVSYNTRFTTTLPPGSTMRLRRYQSMTATS